MPYIVYLNGRKYFVQWYQKAKDLVEKCELEGGKASMTYTEGAKYPTKQPKGW